MCRLWFSANSEGDAWREVMSAIEDLQTRGVATDHVTP
jgi:hypothetical protein